MAEYKLPKKLKIIVCIAALAILMYFLYPKKAFFQYTYHIGSPWNYETLVAPFDFPILKTDEQILAEREAKSSQIVEYFQFDETIGDDQLIALENSVASATGLNDTLAMASSLVMMRLEGIYEEGILLNAGNPEKVIFIKKGKRAKETPMAELYTPESAYQEIRSDIAAVYNAPIADSLINLLKVRSYIVPNLQYDEKTTDLVHREAVEYISPTDGTIYAGQLIVSNGEMITAEISQLLNSYKAEYNKSYGLTDMGISYKLALILFILMTIVLLSMNILFTDSSIFDDPRKYTFVFVLFFTFYLILSIAIDTNPSLVPVIPFSLIVLYSQAFFKPTFVFPNYVISLIPLLLMTDNGMVLFLSNLTAGGVLLLAFQRFNRGWMQFLNTLFVFSSLFIVYAAFCMRGNWGFNRIDIAYFALNSILVVICYPIVFLFERIFSLVSNVRLWELSDTNNELLQELAMKAPGTFQHSLQVASIAEDACKKIGANASLVKAGALYHDIGKIMNPTCFVENQTSTAGEIYHNRLSPKESARDIIRHVEDGKDLARKNHLPDVIIEFIGSHHGTTTVSYFYNQFCNNGGDPSEQGEFTYKGRRPHTKEESVLMIADSIEAATRTLKEHNEESIRPLVSKIIQDKTSSGQLTVSDLSLKEIDTIKESIINYLLQIYHGRIAYPELKKGRISVFNRRQD